VEQQIIKPVPVINVILDIRSSMEFALLYRGPFLVQEIAVLVIKTEDITSTICVTQPDYRTVSGAKIIYTVICVQMDSILVTVSA